MTGDQARNLEVGHYVCWNGALPVDIGIIMDVSLFGVTIRRADGRATTSLFNDMKRMSHIDINGRIISP